MNILCYILAILIFSVFDVVGYHYILTKKQTIKPTKFNLVLYRVIQNAVMLSIIYWLYLIDFQLAIAFTLSWWFGLCDCLYYVILRQWEMFESDDMFWLWWTPYGLAGKIFRKWKFGFTPNGDMLIVFSCLALVFSLIILYQI